MKQIRHRKALVTGAASGIGRAIALALAKEGADLYLLDVDQRNLQLVVKETEKFGVETIGVRCDLTKPNEIVETLDEMLSHWGKLDILINNAGVAYYGPTENMTSDQWDWLMSINLMAAIRITGHLLPTLKEQLEAHILNVCSISGLVAAGRMAAYHTSKFGLIGYTEALRAEYGRQGIGVTALCPGPVQTKLYESAVSGREDRPVPNPPRFLCASEETVAKRAISAIRRNKRMPLITPMAHALFQLKRFAPGLIDTMNQLGRRKKMKKKRIAWEQKLLLQSQNPDSNLDQHHEDRAA